MVIDIIIIFFLRNKSFLEILSSCDYKTYAAFSEIETQIFVFLNSFCSSFEYSSLFVSSCNAPQHPVTRQKWLQGRLTHSQGGLLGHFVVFLPSQCWWELTVINNIGRMRRQARTEITVLGGSVSTIYVQDCRFQEALIKFRGSGRDCQFKIQTLLIRSFQ